jgi:hypothetical protein
MLELASMREALTGGVTFIQRFAGFRGKACAQVNVHFHSLFLNGVFVRDEDGALEFHKLDEPSPEKVADVAARTAKRVIKLLDEAGRSLDPELSDDEVEELSTRQPALAALYAAARGVDLSGDRAGQPTMGLIQKDDIRKAESHAVVGGINIHAAVAFDARDKPRMERMCIAVRAERTGKQARFGEAPHRPALAHSTSGRFATLRDEAGLARWDPRHRPSAPRPHRQALRDDSSSNSVGHRGPSKHT